METEVRGSRAAVNHQRSEKCDAGKVGKCELAVSSCVWRPGSGCPRGLGWTRSRERRPIFDAGSSLHLQERHRSLRLRHREGGPGGRRRTADPRRPDPVRERRGREVGHSGGHGGAAQGRKKGSGTFNQAATLLKTPPCVAALRWAHQAGGGPVQGGTLPLGEKTFREQPGTERRRGGRVALFPENSAGFLFPE